ncbi:hypothetical protein X975_20220, partial [Stegodyphus mimosarum]
MAQTGTFQKPPLAHPTVLSPEKNSMLTYVSELDSKVLMSHYKQMKFTRIVRK